MGARIQHERGSAGMGTSAVSGHWDNQAHWAAERDLMAPPELPEWAMGMGVGLQPEAEPAHTQSTRSRTGLPI